MTGKQRILNVHNQVETDKIPWVPFAGVHAASLVGYNATEVLTDSDKLFEALMEAHKLYQPDGLPAIFDLQVEAEILGCELVWADKGPASVKTHPYADTDEMPCDCLIPKADAGRIPMITDTMKKLKAEIGDTTALYGLICGPFTLASHLRGNNIFMDMIMKEDYVKDLMAFCTKVSLKMIDHYLEAGMDVIAVVDPLVSQISPEHFTTLCHESFNTVFEYVRAKGAISSFFVCGNATRQLEVMCKTAPDGISIDENVDMIAAKEISDKYNVVIGGNIPLTTLMLHGTQQDNMKYVVELLDNISHDNLIIAPGCDMPFDVPADNTIAVQQAVRETEKIREMIANYESPELDIDVELPDYASLEKPLVEAFTLDSETCAACTYMWDAVVKMKDQYGDKIDTVEYKFTEKENIARCVKMGVKNLPAVYINGELKWSSIIPSREEFEAEINKAMK